MGSKAKDGDGKVSTNSSKSEGISADVRMAIVTTIGAEEEEKKDRDGKESTNISNLKGISATVRAAVVTTSEAKEERSKQGQGDMVLNNNADNIDETLSDRVTDEVRGVDTNSCCIIL